MTAQDFKKNWTNTKEPLSPLSPARLARFQLQQSTVDFLTIAGLPVYCEPDLSFANDTDDTFNGINKLTEQYEFYKNKADYEKYVVIGYCRDGDAIAIDTNDHDKIVELDHRDSFRHLYFNSSLNALADFLILYKDFEEEVLTGKDKSDNFQIFNFTNDQFNSLKQKMFAVDENAMTQRGFWKEELEIMLSIRHDRFGTLL